MLTVARNGEGAEGGFDGGGLRPSLSSSSSIHLIFNFLTILHTEKEI